MGKSPKSKFCLYRGSKSIYLALVEKPELKKAEKLLKQDREIIIVYLHHDKHAQQFAFNNSLRSVSVRSIPRLLRWTSHLVTTKKSLAKKAHKKGIKAFVVERFHGSNSLF